MGAPGEEGASAPHGAAGTRRGGAGDRRSGTGGKQVRQAFRAAAALAAVALLAAGCAKPSSSSSGSGSGSGSGTAKFTGCMVTDTGGINDKSFNQSSWAGMQAAAAANPNITVKYLPSTTTSDYAKNISTFI